MSDLQQNTAIPNELRDRANDVLERLFALDDAVANARAFRATLEDRERQFTERQNPRIAVTVHSIDARYHYLHHAHVAIPD